MTSVLLVNEDENSGRCLLVVVVRPNLLFVEITGLEESLVLITSSSILGGILRVLKPVMARRPRPSAS